MRNITLTRSTTYSLRNKMPFNTDIFVQAGDGQPRYRIAVRPNGTLRISISAWGKHYNNVALMARPFGGVLSEGIEIGRFS